MNNYILIEKELKNWEDISSKGTHVNEDRKMAEIGFNFPFYGKKYNELEIEYVGLITFSPKNFRWGYTTGQSIPTYRGYGDNLIAGLWDYLLPNNTCGVKNLHYLKREKNGIREFIVQWKNCIYKYSTVKNTFQIVIRENGEIQINYLDVHSRSNEKGQKTFAGIENENGRIGLQYDGISKNTGNLKNKTVVFKLPNSNEVPEDPNEIDLPFGEEDPDKCKSFDLSDVISSLESIVSKLKQLNK